MSVTSDPTSGVPASEAVLVQEIAVPPLPVNAPASAMVAVGLPSEFAQAAEATHLFSELLASENVALREHAIDRVIALGERKMALARLYEDRLHTLAERTDLNGSLPPLWKEDLGSLAQRLQSVAEENASLLKAHIAAAERVLYNIAEAVKKVQPKEAYYSRSGSVGRTTNPESQSLSINTKV